MIRLAFVLLLLAGGARADEPGKVTAAGWTLAIVREGQACLIEFRSPAGQTGLLRFELPAACAFARNPDGALRIERQNGAHFLLLEAALPGSEPPRACRTANQAIRISAADIRASRSPDRVTSCLPFHWDRQVLTGRAFGD